MAVHLARENNYDGAARIYRSINADRRAARMEELARLYREADASLDGKYRLAEFLSENGDRIYFNDRLWNMQQRYALIAAEDVRLTRQERDQRIEAERKLKDDQEERWQAYRSS